MISRSARHARDPLVWVFILTAALSLLGVADMARELGAPFGGYVSYRRTAASIGEVDANTPIWWSGLIGGRLTTDATLLTAGGLPYYPNARAAFAEGLPRGYTAVTFLRPDGERPMIRYLPVGRFTLAQFLDVRLPDLIMAVVFWLLALVVYQSDPGHPTNRAFALVCALVALVRSLYVHNLFLDDVPSLLIEIVLLTVIPLMGVVLLNFAAKFPVPAGPRWNVLVLVALAPALIFSACAVLARLPGFAPETAQRFGSINYFGTLILYVIGLAGLTGRLARRLARRRHLSRRERRVLLIVLGGLFVAMPALVVSALTWVSIDGRPIDYYARGLDLRYLMLVVPLAFAYALVRYRSLRGTSLLFIFVILLAFSALVAAAGAWAWTWGQPTWPENGLRPPFTSLFGAALVSSLIWGAAASARGTFGRIFHYDRRASAAARNFGRRVTGHTDLKTLPTSIVEALVEELELERAAIWLTANGGAAPALAGQHGRFRITLPAALPLDPPVDSRNAHLRRAALVGVPLRIDRPESAPDWLRPIAGDSAFEVALPLVAGGVLIGLIALGPRWDEGIFDDRDLENAELIGQQASLFLAAAAGMAELRRVPGRMADVQDRERLRLARELHDTIQQFLGRLPFYLSVSRDAILTRPDLARDILDRAISDVEEASVSVRQIRHNLAPSQLEHGLTPAVVALGRHFEERTGIRTTVEIAADVDPCTTAEARHALYRVIQQSLDNVEAHAGATAVAIELAVNHSHVHFRVHDNGRGLNEAARLAARQQGSYGLESMRARLEAGGGAFHIRSTPGGTEVTGTMPAPAPFSPDLASN